MSNRRIAKFAQNVDGNGELAAASLASADTSIVSVYDSAGLIPTADSDLTGRFALDKSSRDLYVSDGVGWYELTLGIQRRTSWLANSISGLSYDTASFSVGSQEADPFGIAFKPDGTRMYIIGTVGDDINEYHLSTAWDISTASFSQASISTATENPLNSCLAMSDDGVYAYVGGASSDKITQWQMTTPWDVSTLTFVRQSVSLSGQETAMTSLYFSPDGTKMIVGGVGTDRILKYELSTAWDVSTVSYPTTSLMSLGTEYEVQGVYFNNDGTQMFTIGSYFSRIYGYSLSTAWDVSTTSALTGTYFSFTQDTVPIDLAISEDGTKLYTLSRGSDEVHQFSMDLA